jgi:hypothetical protein
MVSWYACAASLKCRQQMAALSPHRPAFSARPNVAE